MVRRYLHPSLHWLGGRLAELAPSMLEVSALITARSAPALSGASRGAMTPADARGCCRPAGGGTQVLREMASRPEMQLQ
jgi:hypothetical protein